MDILTVDNVTKAYTGKQALSGVSLAVPEGGVHGLLGPNGAGKTTLLRIINHITLPDAGGVEIFGHRLTAADTRLIGYLPEERGLYKKMKVGEQALFFARLKGMDKATAKKELETWFARLDIMSWWNKRVEELSKGMAQKIQFVITVLHRPRLLILDEPFSGLDPVNANVLRDEILRLKNDGCSIIFSTHNMASVESLCDNITLVNNGRDILSGDVAEIRASHGLNRWRLAFKGDTPALERAAEPFVTRFDAADGRADITLRDADARRGLINAANDAVDLLSFEPLMPSMDEIFVNAVKQSTPPDQ